MILVISALKKTQDCVRLLQEVANEPVELCSTLPDAVIALQTQEFSAVVFDQLLLDAEPDEGETAAKHLGTAVPVYLNFAISSSARLVSELRSGLRRRQRELFAARKDAELALRQELKDAMTALLLSCELALQAPDVPASAQAKMQGRGSSRPRNEREAGGASLIGRETTPPLAMSGWPRRSQSPTVPSFSLQA